MGVNEKSLKELEQHWAVQAIALDLREQAFDIAKIRLVRSAVGQLLIIQSQDRAEDNDLLNRVSMAYELAAVEGLESLLHPSNDNEHLREQAQAGAFKAYELLRVFSIPQNDEDRIFHLLHLSALAYCGDYWTDLRRWLKANEQQIKSPTVANAPWDRRILYRLFDCWIRLVRKQGWDDIDGIREIIAGLRKDQLEFEKDVLNNEDNEQNRAVAIRLITLYHWAKATELLAIYTLQGEPVAIESELDKHFEAAIKALSSTNDAPLEILIRWLHVTSRRMVAGSLWKVAHSINSRVSRFVKSGTKVKGLFELLPPQRAALQEQGLLDQASRAVVVDLPTSGGKTTLAEFRILQALNQFDADKGWVAYVAPTRALVTQLTRRLREDFSPLGIQVEQLTGAVEIDAFEENLLTASKDQASFDVIIATPEKMQFVIRNKKVTRPLALIVLDEAHNIEDEERGLRIELLLATIKRESASTSFLLLMPYVPNATDLARWLGDDSGKTISIGTSAWQPNERIVGLFRTKPNDSVRAGWTLEFETLTTTPKTIHLRGTQKVGSVKPLDLPHSKAKGLTVQAGAMAKVFSERGTSIAIAQKIPDVWSLARLLVENIDPYEKAPDEVALVQRFLQTEISPRFELIEMLNRGIGVHHAGLSDETRSLIEWLAETGNLRVLCATTTIAQGINFPVSSVFMATRLYPYGIEMSPRAFWNLAGRAGRINHESVGVVGIAAGDNPKAIKKYVQQQTGALISRLISLLDQVERVGKLQQLSLVIQEDQWSDFRSYVAHLWNEKKNLDAVLAETEQLLRSTYGFGVLRGQADDNARRKAHALLDATSDYARKLALNPGTSVLADATGFAPEGVAIALAGLNQLQHKLTSSDWEPASLFSGGRGSSLSNLVGVMMRIPGIAKSLSEISSGGMSHQHIAKIANAWVSGHSIEQIARNYFSGKTPTELITNTCKALYRVLSNNGAWGISALSKIGIENFESLDSALRRRINNLPAMIYHGVNTEAAVLMRMNSIPRSIATNLGKEFERQTGAIEVQTVGNARAFLKSLRSSDWDRAVNTGSHMSGNDYKNIWTRLSGEVST